MSPRTGKPAASADKAGTPANPARRTQQERSSQAEKALMDAATELFARRGVDQTSLADVGEAAGYSRGLVNHHFGTKATLVERLARRAQTDFVTNFDEVGGDAASGIRHRRCAVPVRSGGRPAVGAGHEDRGCRRRPDWGCRRIGWTAA